MAIKSPVPDYDLDDTLELTSSAQVRAIGNPLRTTILGLLHERAATVTEMATAVGRPKSTVAYHVGILHDAGLVRVVRTRRVRAIEERYFGRTARMFYVGVGEGAGGEALPLDFNDFDVAGKGVPGCVSSAPVVVVHPPRTDSAGASRRILGRGDEVGPRVRPASAIGKRYLRVRDRGLPEPWLPGAARP